jgi:hypothetical protein
MEGGMSVAILLLLLATGAAGTAEFDGRLALEGETVVFSFGTGDGRVLSVCVGNGGEYLVYRFGTPDGVELQYPEDPGPGSWDLFDYSWYFRAQGPGGEGLDLHYLRFGNRDVAYTVYDECWSPDSGPDQTAAGVRVESGGKEMDIRGLPGSVTGTLSDLRWEYGDRWGEH